MFKGGDEVTARFGIMAQPMQQLGEAPFRGIHSAAPTDRFQTELVGFPCNLEGFLQGAVITPEIVFIQRLEIRADRNHTRTRGVECDCVYG